MNYTAKFRVGLVVRIYLSLLIGSMLIIQPCAALAVVPERAGPALTADQRVSQALLRLSFGVRPGDFDAVKKIGVAKYIEQQLNPDSIDDSALDKRLAKLPTLMFSNPTMAEQYNPPKPTPTLTPTPATTPTGASPTADASKSTSTPKMDAASPMMNSEAMMSAAAPSILP